MNGLHLLSEKIQNASRTVVLEKKREKEEVEERIENMEVSLAWKKKFQVEAIEKSRGGVESIQIVSEECMKSMKVKEKKEEEVVRGVKEQIENDLDFDGQEHEEKIEQVIQRCTEVMTERIQENDRQFKAMNEKNEKMVGEIDRFVKKLEKDLKDETEARKSNCKRIQSDVEQEILKFHEMLQREEERRENSEEKLQRMMEDIGDKMEGDIEWQAKKRKKNNDLILKLIQSACQRLEDKLQA